MRGLNGSLAKVFLRYATSIGKLRRVPIVGNWLSWVSRKLVPEDTQIWVQIEHGPAKGLWIRVNPRTGRHVQQGGGESEMQQALAEHLKLGQTFYDLGANIGFFSLMAARLVGPEGRVISFEADPEIAERLRENLAYNKFANASVEQKAVWSEPGKIKFARVDPSASPDRGLGRVTLDATGDTISVEAVTLDQYCASHAEPDFVKCDVEGAEAAVFEGAQRLLRGKKPRLLVEMHSSENHKQLRKQFQEMGYACQDLDDHHLLALPL